MTSFENLVLLFADWPFFMFHLTVVLFVGVQLWRRNSDYGEFFVLYLVLAINDAVNFVQVNLFLCNK